MFRPSLFKVYRGASSLRKFNLPLLNHQNKSDYLQLVPTVYPVSISSCLLHSSSSHNDRSYDDINNQVLDFLNVKTQINEQIRNEQEYGCLEETVKRHIITSAHSEKTDCWTVIELFRLYSLYSRPFMEEKTAIPAEFNKMVWQTDQLTKYMTFEELKSLSLSLMSLRGQKLNFINKLIISVCSECSTRIKDNSLKQGIEYFEIILNLFASGMGKRDNYDIFVEFFERNISLASETDLIKLMHYSSFNQNKYQKKIVEKSLDRLNNCFSDLSFEMLGIITNSILRSGIPLNTNLSILPFITQQLLKNIDTQKDITVFQKVNIQCMVKLFRLSKYKDFEFIKAFHATLLQCNANNLDGDIIAQILGYFAQVGYNEIVFTKLEFFLIGLIASEDASLSITEYARILWAFSHTNHTPTEKTMDLIKQDLYCFVSSCKAFRSYAKFADCLYSLAIMGYSDPNLLKSALAPQTNMTGIGPAKRKMVKRLSGLHEHIKIDFPDLCPMFGSIEDNNTNDCYTNQAELHSKPLVKLAKYLNSSIGESDNEYFAIAKPFETINIHSICCTQSFESLQSNLSVCLSKMSPISINILDDNNCVDEYKGDRVVRRMNGLMAYKIKLLKKSGWFVLLLNGTDINETDDLESYVKKIIDFCQRD